MSGESAEEGDGRVGTSRKRIGRLNRNLSGRKKEG